MIHPDVNDLLTDAGTLDVLRRYFPNFKRLKQVFETDHSKRVNIYQHQGIYLVKDFAAKEFPDDKARTVLQVIQYYHNCDFKEARSILAAELGIMPAGNSSAPARVVPRPRQVIKAEPEAEIIQVAPAKWNVTKAQHSNFHLYARSLGVTSEHLEKWLVGSELKGDTVFTVFGHQGKGGELVNLKYIKYLSTGKRDKKYKPFYLKNSKEQKYGQNLYGAHLMRDGVPVVVVESEKTAVLGSFFYPQYDFVATGGATALSKKIKALAGKKGYVLHDADSTGRKLSTWNLLHKYGLRFVPVDLFKNRSDGYDLADALCDGLRPDITSWKYQLQLPECPDFKLYVNEYASEEAEAFTAFLLKHRKVVLTGRTGIGKTTLTDYIAKHVPGRVFILEPLTVIVDAIAKSKYGQAAIIKQGATAEDVQTAINSKVTVCTYDSFSKVGDLLTDDDLLICDEIHALTLGYSMQDKREKYDYVFRRIQSVKNVLCISATPQDIFRDYGFKYAEIVAGKMNRLLVNPVIYKGKIQHKISQLLPTLDYERKQYIIRLNSRPLIDQIISNFEGLPAHQIAVLSSETKDEPGGVYQSIVSTKSIPEHVRLVFTTSLIDCGVDIYNKNVELHVVEHQNESLSITDTLQFMARCRKVARLKVFIYKQERKVKDLDGEQIRQQLFDFAGYECETLNSLNVRFLAASPLLPKGAHYSETAQFCKYNHALQRYEVNELLIHHKVEQDVIRSTSPEAFFSYLEQQEHIIMQDAEQVKVAPSPEAKAQEQAAKLAKEIVQEQTFKMIEAEYAADIFTALYHTTKDLELKKSIVRAGYNITMNPSAEHIKVRYGQLLTDRVTIQILKNYIRLQMLSVDPEGIPVLLRENKSSRRAGDLFTRLETLYKIEHAETLPAAEKRDVARLLQHKQTIEKHLTELTSFNNKIANRVSADTITTLINKDRHKGIRLTKNKAMQLFHILFETDVMVVEENGKTAKYYGIVADNTVKQLTGTATVA